MKRLHKLIIWPVAIIFLFQNIGWTAPIPQLSTINHQPLAIFIPAQYGSVEKSNLAKDQTIILIKDAHCNYEAQTNIAKILDILIRDYKIDLVCVEGAEGIVDTVPYNAFPDQSARDRVTDKYIRKGILSASEALNISNGNKQPFTIWGVEDSRLYLSDFKAFRETLIENTEYIEFLSEAFKSVNLLKIKIYNKRLLRFDNRFKEYSDNRTSFSDWISYTRTFIPGLGHYKNIVYAVKSIRLENETDFKKVEDERTRLIKELEKRLTKEDLQELVRQSLLFKLGKIPAVQYYSYLERYISNVPRDSTINLKKYIRSVHIQALIDSDGLFNELYQLESQIYSNLCKDEIETKLHRIDTNLTILNKLLNLLMSRQDLSYYKEHIDEFDPKGIAEFINSLSPSPIPIPQGNRNSAEKFYELAVERDNVLVNNLLSQMEKTKKQNAALVIGGFHAEGIIRQLEDRRFSYVVISPKITSIQGDNPYLSIMLDERIDIDKLVEDISGTTLAPPLSLGNMGDTEARRRLAKDLIEFRNRPLKDLLARYTGSDADAIRELCRVAGMGLAEMAVEERKVEEFITPQLLTDQIITAENPVFTAFLLDLLIAQISEKPREVEEALNRIIKPILQGSDLGRYLSPEAMDRLSANPDVQIEVFSEEQDVVSEGDPSDSIYLVVSGQLEVSTEALGTIATLQNNTIFGEIGVLTNQVRTATVKVKGRRAVLLRIGKNAAIELKEELEEFARKRLIDQIERLRPRSIIVPIRDLKELSLQELETLRWQMERSTQALQNRPVVPARLGEWKTKLDKLTKEEAEEYNSYMKEIGNFLMASGMPEKDVIQFLEQLDNLILAQDIVNEQFAYIPLNARHVLNTARNIITILDHENFRQRREYLELRYGKERLIPVLLFLALSSQVGFRIVEVGKPETFNRYKEIGSKMIMDNFGEVIRTYLGQEALDSILDAVEKQGVRKEGMLTSNNPLLFMLSIAQWMDISSKRLTEWQKNPFFIQILSKINVNSQYIQMKRNVEKAHREKSSEFTRLRGDLRDLIYKLSSEELEKLRSKRLVPDEEYKQIKRALRSIDLEGLDFFLGTAMIEDIQIDFDAEGMLVVNVYAVDKALEYGSFANTDFYVNLVVERMQRYISSITMEGIKVNITSSELHVELGEFIERLPMAELHSHLNGAIEFNRQWQELIRLYLAKQAKDWNNVNGKNINAKLQDLYKDKKIDLNDIFQTAMTTRIFLIMVLKEHGEAVSDETSDLELLPLVDKHIKREEDPEHSDLFIMLRHYINTRNQFRSFVEYLPIEVGKLPEFVMHFAVGSGIGKAGDRERELKHLENNAYHLARSSYRANGYYYEYRINLGKTREETREEVEAIIRGIARAEEEIARDLRKGEPGFEGRIVLSFGRMGNSPEEYARQAREFVAMLSEDPRLLERIVGIDVANQEEETPPEAFAEAFKIIAVYNDTLPADTRLQMTYHVGEGFTDVSLETSLRFVDEVINYGASRLGHAIILGIDPGQFTKEPREEKVAERIKTLNWIRGLSKELNLEYFTIEYIDNELKSLAGETVSVSYNDAARRDIERIQDHLLTKVIERNIVIETNPTSNSQIVTGNDMTKHPLRKFLTFRHNDQRVKFTINTDDAGVFGTDLRREYLRAAKAFGLTVRQLWEIASQGFRAHMGRKLRYHDEIQARLRQIQTQTVQPTVATAAIGTKSHKLGTPKVAGRDAINSDVDYIIDGMFRQDRVRGGFQADPRRSVVNQHIRSADGRPKEIEFRTEEEHYFERANYLIQNNMEAIVAMFQEPATKRLLRAQLGKLLSRREALKDHVKRRFKAMRPDIQRMSAREIEKFREEIQELKEEIDAVDRHIELLNNFMNKPREIFNERINSMNVLILEGLDFLVFNDAFNYWAGHSSTSRNAVYIPERIFRTIRESPQAMAAFLMDEIIDAIAGEHTELSDRLIQLMDPEARLTDGIKGIADKNYIEAYALARIVSELVNTGNIIDAINRIHNALFKDKTISPSSLLMVLDTVLANIDPRYSSTFTFTVSITPELRNAINSQVRQTAITETQGIEDPIVELIRRPQLIISDEWLVMLYSIKEALNTGRGNEVLDYIAGRLGETGDLAKLKRYLAVVLLNLDPRQYHDGRFKDFVYTLLGLTRVKEIYPLNEYMDLVIQTVSKLEGIEPKRVEETLMILARPDIYPVKNWLASWRYRRLFNMGLDADMIREYFRTKTSKPPIVEPRQIKLDLPLDTLSDIGYKKPGDFIEEITLLINEKGLLEESLPFITPEGLRQAEIVIGHIATTGHTLVTLVSVVIGGDTYSFVLKKGFRLFELSIPSDVFNKYSEAVRESNETPLALAQQYGEWITPITKDGRLLGHYRTEKYLAGSNLSTLQESFTEGKIDAEMYRLAASLAAANYYLLFKYVTKGKWFLWDATGSNVMLIPTADGSLTSRVIDIEARVELPEGLTLQNFIALLENRGFRKEDILTGVGIAEYSTGKGRFDLSMDFKPDVIARLVSFIKGESPVVITEPISITEPMTLRRDVTSEGKVVAIGDVHGELDGLKEILREASLIDKDDHWIGGNARVVQLGDIVDRGPPDSSKKTLEYLLQLQEEARRAGGDVVILLGNHELAYLTKNTVSGMRLEDVLKKSQAGQATEEEVDDAEREYFEIRRLLIDAVSNGQIQAMYAVGNTIFVHAGIRPIIYTLLRKQIAKEKGISVDEVDTIDIADYCNKILLESVTYKDHFIFRIGNSGESERAGIFWARPNEHAKEIPGIRQVVGHTERDQIEYLPEKIMAMDVKIRKGRRAYLEMRPEGAERVIRGITKGDSGTWQEAVITRTTIQPAGLVHFEELRVLEDTARGVLSINDIPGMGSDEQENARRIVDFIQKNGKSVETNLGLPVKIWDRPEDSELNKLLIDNLAGLLPEEFLTTLRANAPPEGLVLAILDRSQHLGENCQGDGFIGVNRYLLQKLKDATDQPTIDALSNLLQVILYHELRHEARTYEGDDEELRLNLRDIALLDTSGIDILIALRLLNPESKFKKIADVVNEIGRAMERYGAEIDTTKREGLKEILLKAYEGKVQINLLELMNMLAERIEPEKIFQLTAEIAEPINRFLGSKAADKGGAMVAAVLQEILGLMPIVAETEEDKLLKAIQAIAREKGIDPNAMQSVFDLFKAGLEILAVDPSYKLDSNYFVLISQIEKLTGIDDKKIIEVFSRHGLAKEKAEAVPNSPLAQEVEKLGLYLELTNMSIRGDLDLGLEQRRRLFYLDNLKARIERTGDIQFLSGVDAVNKDMANAYSTVQASPGGGIIDRTERITLVVSADTLMSVEREGRFLRFSYKPGIQALLKILANSKNIHIVIRADKEARQVLEEIGILNEQVTVEDTEKKLADIRTDAELKDWAKDEDHVVFLLTPEEGDSIDTKGMKAFGIDPTTAFHAALLFAITYAQAQTTDEIVTAINTLILLGMAPSEVEEIVRKIKEEGLGFFTVRLVRIEETLKEFQNRRLYIEVAA